MTFTATGNRRAGRHRHARQHRDRVGARGRRPIPTPATTPPPTPTRSTPQADLSITKTDGQATRRPGHRASPTRSSSATPGPSTVAGATVTDTFPAAPHRRELDLRRRPGGATCTRRPAPATSATTVTLLPGGTAHLHRDRHRSPRPRPARWPTPRPSAAPRAATDPNPAQQHRDRHRHADAAGRPGDHEDRRRRPPRCPARSRHLHDRGQQRRARAPPRAPRSTDAFPAASPA